MNRPPRLTLQGWLLALILPLLGVLVVLYAGHVYFRLYNIVMAGFESKLTAVSTTTAAFIDPADHRRLMEPLPLANMTHDPADPTLWALDVSRHTLMKIRPEDGMALDTGIEVPSEIDNLSNDLKAGNLLLADDQTGLFEHFATATGKITPAFHVDPPVSAIGTIMRRNSLYVAGRDLRRVDLGTGQVSHLNSLPEPIRDLSYDKKRDILWGLVARGDALLAFDPATGNVLRRVELTYEKPADGSNPPPVELHTLVFERISETLFGSAESLVRIDPESGVVSGKDFLPGFGQEQGPIYRRYAEPMRRIISRANLTFLYTQRVHNGNHIIYGLDGTAGADHSPLQSADLLPDSEVAGVEQLMNQGTTYMSGIQPWEQWGILKSAYAPIFDELGRPIAMVGSDINITIIQFQTRSALVFSFALGGALLLLCGLLTLSVARGLTGPLGAIKTAAVHAAAGDYDQRAEVARPRELSELAKRFSSVSSSLGRQVKELREMVSARHTARERTALAEQLFQVPPLAGPAAADFPCAWGDVGRGSTAGGAVRQGERILAWVADPGADPLATAARRAAVAVVADSLLQRHESDPQALGSDLEPLFRTDVAAWALLTPDGWRVSARRSSLLFFRSADGTRREIPSDAFGDPLRPEDGESLVLAGPNAPFADLDAAGPAVGSAALLSAWRRSAASRQPAAFAVIGARGTS